MQRILIDTDTASDDAVAMILALREPDVQVEAITVVAGNLPIGLAVKNALISIQVANTYQPPVFRGMAKPLLRDLFTSEFVHGIDGMGDMNLPEPTLSVQSEHAVDALIRIIEANPYELELVTLGPLTNIAMVCLKSPETIKKLKRITIMGSAGLGSGNITPVAEFNIYVDAEAMQIVLASGAPIFLVGWDACLGNAFLDAQEIQKLAKSGSPIAEFCLRCNRSVQEFNLQRFDSVGIDLPDPSAMVAALYPDTVLETLEVYAEVETKGDKTYGQVIIDTMGLLEKSPNVTLCKSLDGAKFKQRLFDRII